MKSTEYRFPPKAALSKINIHTSIMNLPRIIPTLAALVLATATGHGAITVVATNTSVNGFSQAPPTATTTFSFDAGSTADMLVVTYSGEVGSPTVTGPTVRITYDGNQMIRARSGTFAGIFYLDLATTTYAGGAANLVVDLSDWGSRNGLAIGAVSINGALDPGESIALHTTAGSVAGSAQSVTLNTTVADAFAVASFNSDGTSGTVGVNSPMTQIYARANIGSARAGAGYEANVAPGDHTYTWTTNATARSAMAASFIVVPEPSAFALTGLGLAGLLLRRRR